MGVQRTTDEELSPSGFYRVLIAAHKRRKWDIKIYLLVRRQGFVASPTCDSTEDPRPPSVGVDVWCPGPLQVVVIRHGGRRRCPSTLGPFGSNVLRDCRYIHSHRPSLSYS